MKVAVPMEAMLVVFFGLLVGWVSLTLFVGGFAGAGGKWASEDNPRAKAFREVHCKEPTPLQTTKVTVPVAESPEKAAVSSDHPREKPLVQSFMVKTPYYCREDQSAEEALEMMLDLGLPYLPVLDSTLRVVGVVSMRDLMLRKEQKDPPESGK